MITYDDYSKIEIRVGTVKNCEPVAGSNKLYKLDVDFGPLGERTILTGMQAYYQPTDFIGLQTLFLYNLEYRKMMGLESQGMILAIGLDHSKKPILINLHGEVENGDGVN
jgi:methionine--tRNA ligase beta chain